MALSCGEAKCTNGRATTSSSPTPNPSPQSGPTKRHGQRTRARAARWRPQRARTAYGCLAVSSSASHPADGREYSRAGRRGDVQLRDRVVARGCVQHFSFSFYLSAGFPLPDDLLLRPPSLSTFSARIPLLPSHEHSDHRQTRPDVSQDAPLRPLPAQDDV